MISYTAFLKILQDPYIMVKVTFNIPLLDISLHMPIVPHKSRRFIQTLETVGRIVMHYLLSSQPFYLAHEWEHAHLSAQDGSGERVDRAEEKFCVKLAFAGQF
jgi:hypothetical protein